MTRPALRACLVLALVLLALVRPEGAAAQAVAPVAPVLTLDQNRLYTESLYGKALEARALAASQSLAAENRKIEADLAAEESDLTQKRAGMTAQAFQSLADAFDAKVEQLRSDQAAKVSTLNTQRDEGRASFFKAVVPILGDLMKQLGAYAILDHGAVVLAFDSIDVTDRAIKAVDASLGDGSASTGPRLPPPAQPKPAP